MDIGITDGETEDKGGGGFHNAKGRGGKDATSKGGASVLYLTGNMVVGRLAGNTSDDGEGKRKGGTECVAQFLACAAGG